MVHPYIQSILDSEIAKTSKTLYVLNLKKLKELCLGKSLEYIVSNPHAMYKCIAKEYPNVTTRKNMVNAVKAVFKYADGLANAYPKEVEEWTTIHNKLRHHSELRQENGEFSQREAANWVDWPVVLAKLQELAEVEYGSDDHLLLAMYSLQEPLRQDFGCVRLVRRLPTMSTPTRENFMVFHKDGSVQLVLNEYKTAKKYKQYSRTVPIELATVITHSVKNTPRAYLFEDCTGSCYKSRNSFTKFSNGILKRLFKPKKVTVSVLRHSFISSIDFNAATPGSLFRAAKNMAHSIGMQQRYRRTPGVNVAQGDTLPMLHTTHNNTPVVSSSPAPNNIDHHQQQQQPVVVIREKHAPYYSHSTNTTTQAAQQNPSVRFITI
jgi:hypothetical protein